MVNCYERVYAITKSDNTCNEMQVSIYYDKGGWSCLNARQNKRGYYFSITPVQHKGIWTSYGAYTGARTCVLEVPRQSKKKYGEAKAMMNDLIERYLMPFCEKYGYELDSSYQESERERNT